MSACVPVVPRGVYFARHRKNGRLIVFAVDSRGNELRPRLLLRDESQWRIDAAGDWLWNRLDMIDPERRRPALHLVRDNVRDAQLSLARRATQTEFDPYNLTPMPWRTAL